MKDYKTYFEIKAEVQDVFTALTNPFTIELWTGEPAEMSKKEGEEFSLWGGSIVGRNLKIVENKRLVQQWFFGEEGPESIVSITLWPKKNNTSVELEHTNIPDDAYDNIVEGWQQSYFGAVKSLLEI
jgi:uncharacterized protein YndB with AHSA1/START domain